MLDLVSLSVERRVVRDRLTEAIGNRTSRAIFDGLITVTDTYVTTTYVTTGTWPNMSQ